MNAITKPTAAPAAAAAPAATVPNGVFVETVTHVRHYTDRLFAFRTTRPASFRFRSGEFVMIGLMAGDAPVFRAYSIASPSWAEELEFFSIKVPDGPLTSRLQAIRPGDPLFVRKKPTGTLVCDALLPGRRLYLLSTGTGLAPFASVIRDPETYEKFEEVVLVHGCRTVAELQYGVELVAATLEDELVGELARGRLRHVTSATREPHPCCERVTTMIASGRLFADLGVPPLDPAVDRAMICGSIAMLADTKALLLGAGLREGANNAPGEFVIERAFAE